MASTCISKIRAIFPIIVGHTGGYPDPDQRFFSAFCAYWTIAKRSPLISESGKGVPFKVKPSISNFVVVM